MNRPQGSDDCATDPCGCADSRFSCLSGADDPAVVLCVCVCVCTPPAESTDRGWSRARLDEN